MGLGKQGGRQVVGIGVDCGAGAGAWPRDVQNLDQCRCDHCAIRFRAFCASSSCALMISSEQSSSVATS